MLATVPVCLLLSSCAAPLVRFLYGHQWSAAAVPLAVLAALGVGRVLVEAAYDLLVSLGRGATILRIYLTWLLVLVPALWVGADVAGLAGASVAQVVVLFAVVCPALVTAFGRLGVSLGGVGRALVVPLVAGAFLLLVGLVVRAVLDPASDLVELLLVGVLGGLAYVGVAVLLRRAASRGAQPRTPVPLAGRS